MIKSKMRSYAGEIQGNLRHGHGTYHYQNKFFQYDGEWVNGVKEGVGKLTMADGSYYEGVFRNGEITGPGKRYWVSSGNEYIGDFVDGEMHGKGVLKYGNGDVYDGMWADNKREGDGVLKSLDGEVYIGSFHFHKPHGDGRKVFRNSAVYVGGWVNGLQHGHGVMHFEDGSLYEGQWRGGCFHGQGSLTHSSGIAYDGIWLNNRAQLEPQKLCVISNEEMVVSQHNVMFSLKIYCLTADDQITTESGRKFQISAGKYLQNPDCETAPEPVHSCQSLEKTCDYISYPIAMRGVCVELNERGDQENLTDQGKVAEENVVEKRVEEQDVESSECDHGETETFAFVDVEQQSSSKGEVIFNNLILPGSKSSDTCSSLSMSSVNAPAKECNGSRKGTDATSIEPNDRKKILGMVKGKTISSGKKKKSRTKKDDELNERFCKPGDYVLIVKDVTPSPPANHHVETLYYRLKVISPENIHGS